ALYPEFVQGVQADVGFRRNGTLHLAFSDEEAAALREQTRWQRRSGLRVEERGPRAFFFPDEGQVDNRKLLEALRDACQKAGVRQAGTPAEQPDVICAGSWSAQLEAKLPVHPVRGEMLALDAPPPAQVVFGGGGYIVPRGTLTLVGATS